MAKEKQPKPEKAKKEKKGKVMTCPSCEMEIPKKAKICPRCGKALPKKKKSPLAFILPVLLLVVAALVSVVVFAFPAHQADPQALRHGAGGGHGADGEAGEVGARRAGVLRL